jgi:hypothetical protein
MGCTCNVYDFVDVVAGPKCRDPSGCLAFRRNTGSHAPAPDYDPAFSINADAQLQKLVSSFFNQSFGGRKRHREQTKRLFRVGTEELG